MADEKNRSELLTEKEALELELLREDVERKRSARYQRSKAREDNEKGFRESAAKRAAEQGGCNHKKGGKDYASTQKRGDGDNHCIVLYTMPLGDTSILCTRCNFQWLPGTTQKFMPDGKTPNPTGISWRDALRLPTDNSPCGSVLFGIRPKTAAA